MNSNLSQYWKNPDLNYEPPGLAQQKHNNVDCFVVDGFLDDPLAARNTILSLAFDAPPNPEQGVISFNALIPDNLMHEMQIKIERILDKKIEYHPRSKCAMTYENVPKRNVCHVDGGDNMCMFNWTVVVYLNPPEQCQGGTSMYKHIPTGDICNTRGVDFYSNDFRSTDKWQLIEEMEMKFNRALFCPAWRFHGLSYTFGDSLETARMTLNPKVIAL